MPLESVLCSLVIQEQSPSRKGERVWALNFVVNGAFYALMEVRAETSAEAARVCARELSNALVHHRTYHA